MWSHDELTYYPEQEYIEVEQEEEDTERTEREREELQESTAGETER